MHTQGWKRAGGTGPCPLTDWEEGGVCVEGAKGEGEEEEELPPARWRETWVVLSLAPQTGECVSLYTHSLICLHTQPDMSTHVA